MRNKKIVCFGGGSAAPEAILKPLRKYPLEITSITSMTDDGGSTGQLRADFGVLPPGDIRRHILAFSDAPEWKKSLWSFRFGNEEFDGGHKGHSFGNVFMAGLEKNLKNYSEVLQECCRFMEVPKKYKPLPATAAKVTLCAELENGEIIEGEKEIDIPKKHDPKLKIKEVFLKPKAKAYGEAIAAIQKADVIVFGCGDLYSSLLACLLPIGIKSAIQKSKARKILLCNIMNKKGETDDFLVEDFAREVEKYAGAELDYILYNKNIPAEEVADKTRKENPELGHPVLFGADLDRNKFIGVDFLKKGTVWHNPEKAGKELWKLIS